MPRKAKATSSERYPIGRSPLAQKPTQREVAALLGETRDDLRFLATHKEHFIVRRQAILGKQKKARDLRYPVSRLRAVHERLKFHLNKIKQPSYLFSPRKNRGQRDNAALHLGQRQYLTLDIKQFYPSTTARMVRRWFRDELGMYDDVAGLLTHLSTIDDVVSFGSPLTPVLCTLVHRRMFDEIAELCEQRNLRYSVWVDDLTISGDFVARDFVRELRDIIRRYGLKSHKIQFRTGNKPVYITGIGVDGGQVIAPNSLNLRIKTLWHDLSQTQAVSERDAVIQSLLAQLGTQLHVVGSRSKIGQKAANQMNSLRQKRTKMYRQAAAQLAADRLQRSLTAPTDATDSPF
jgi:RNA-directed DNA polymerase